jgi:hypothetical protein
MPGILCKPWQQMTQPRLDLSRYELPLNGEERRYKAAQKANSFERIGFLIFHDRGYTNSRSITNVAPPCVQANTACAFPGADRS